MKNKIKYFFLIIFCIPTKIYATRVRSEYEKNLPINKQFDSVMVPVCFIIGAIMVFLAFYTSDKKKKNPIEISILKFSSFVLVILLIKYILEKLLTF